MRLGEEKRGLPDGESARGLLSSHLEPQSPQLIMRLIRP